MLEFAHGFVRNAAERNPDAVAMSWRKSSISYSQLALRIESFTAGLIQHGLERQARVAVYLPKQPETVVALFATMLAGAVMVPINPILKAAQVQHILRDCNVRILITSPERAAQLLTVFADCPDLHSVILTPGDTSTLPTLTLQRWLLFADIETATFRTAHRIIDQDMAAILYTSGSTGKPKGVVLSHRNLAGGAKSVASYLQNRASDRLLCVLPLSFDYGLSQLTTAFLSGACAVLMEYLFARDVIKAVAEEGITGLAAVPPLWIQLAELPWPEHVHQHLRYATNSGGAMPQTTLEKLRAAMPKTQVYLMYGLTEAFRSTYLPPEQLDKRPNSMGKAIPNAEIMVLREDGSECAPNEPGELVHRGALVSMGYWNNAEATALRFRPVAHRELGLPLHDIAVWSGDTVRMDEEGYLYFVGRKDDMIKTSGYRVSPSEIEEVIYGTGQVEHAAALGIPHALLGQEIVVVVTPPAGTQNVDIDALKIACQRLLPAFMAPTRFVIRAQLPRNANGKIDRPLLLQEIQHRARGQ